MGIHQDHWDRAVDHHILAERLSQCRPELTYQQLAQKFGISVATAWRLLGKYNAANRTMDVFLDGRHQNGREAAWVPQPIIECLYRSFTQAYRSAPPTAPKLLDLYRSDEARRRLQAQLRSSLPDFDFPSDLPLKAVDGDSKLIRRICPILPRTGIAISISESRRPIWSMKSGRWIPHWLS